MMRKREQPGRTILLLALLILLLTATGCDLDDLFIPQNVNSEPAAAAPLSLPAPSPTATAARLPTTTLQPTPTLPPRPDGEQVDVPSLLQHMVDLINEARTAQGLQPVEWDPLAAEAGRQHALDMVQHDYFSHWNREGLGPDHRYNRLGGYHAVQENLHAFSHTYVGGGGVPINDWTGLIEEIQQSLMDSPGHRANILNPAHTHVGIGLAYDAEKGQLRLAQEFTNQYVTLSHPLAETATPGTVLSVDGTVPETDRGAPIDNLLLNVAYEPFPEPMSIDMLNETNVYTSAAEPAETWRVSHSFTQPVQIPPDAQPGLYHVRLFADIGGEQALLMDHIVEVRGGA